MGVTHNYFRWDAVPRGTLHRSHAAALELQQVERGEVDGELGEAHPIGVVEPAASTGDVVEVPHLRVR